MSDVQVKCPQCGNEFEISDVLTASIREQMRGELLHEVDKREKEVLKRKQELEKQQEELEEARAAVEAEVEKQLKAKLKKAEEKAAQAAREEWEEQLEEANSQIAEQRAKLKEVQKQELELRRQQRELQEAKEQAELDMARRLDEERAEIRKAAAKQAAEEHQLKDQEKDRRITELNHALEDMKRKMEQGSMESQGEVLEEEIEARLAREFPLDRISPVPKGINGADIMQTVRNQFGEDCGVILWETKNTRNWSAKWVDKLKEDAIATGASLCMLVSVALPDGLDNFGELNGVWVSDMASCIPLATALRMQLLAVATERNMAEGKSEKMEYVYQYLSGPEFRQKVTGIVEAFTRMQEQIARERRTMERQWKEREKLTSLVIRTTAGMYGELQGIMGGQLQPIEVIELDSAEVKALPGNEAGDED